MPTENPVPSINDAIVTPGAPTPEERLVALKRETAAFLATIVDPAQIPAVLAEYKSKQGHTQEVWNERHRLGQRLRECVDLDVLRGNEPNQDIANAFKERYESNRYADRTQARFIEQTGRQDAHLAGLLLADPQFSQHYEFLSKLPDDDSTILTILERCGGDPNMVQRLLTHTKNNATRIEMIRRMMAIIAESTDDKARRKALADAERPRESLAGTLISQDFPALLQLFDDGVITMCDIRPCMHQLQTDTEVYELLKRSDSIESIRFVSKFLSDPATLRRIADEGAVGCIHLDASAKERTAAHARTVATALEDEPSVVSFGLRSDGENKFVMALDREQYVILWSRTDWKEYHKDIFDAYGIDSDKRTQQFGSGGFVNITRKPDGGCKAVFERRSGDFGHYNHHVLRRFAPHLLAELKAALKTDDVELVIKQS